MKNDSSNDVFNMTFICVLKDYYMYGAVSVAQEKLPTNTFI